jgi:hypothetical protein
MPKKKKVDADLEEQIRRFQVICNVAIKTAGSGYQGPGKSHTVAGKGGSLLKTGENVFGLTASQAQHCIAKARDSR